MIECDHQWNWDKEIRFCLKCRQVRTFPTDDKEPRILWQGLEEKRNPLELSKEDKIDLAHFAKELGIKKTSDCIKIPLKILRAWNGAYCRKPKLSKSESEVGTEVAKSDLPPFPPFCDKWAALVQLEWLETYRELIKLRRQDAGRV